MYDPDILLENERNQQMRMQCIDYATRIVGKPIYILSKDGKNVKYQEDVVEVANKIHAFVTDSK